MQPLLAPAPVQHDSAAEQTLREHLLAQVQSGPETSLNATTTANIDPAIAGASMARIDHDMGMAAMPHMETTMTSPGGSKKGAKRELSTSKRAQQNRAAQRAFRLRKESYIRGLEDNLQGYHLLKEATAVLESENYSLRNYIISLQSSLLEANREIPTAPHNIDLTTPRPSVLSGLADNEVIMRGNSATAAAHAAAEIAALVAKVQKRNAGTKPNEHLSPDSDSNTASMD